MKYCIIKLTSTRPTQVHSCARLWAHLGRAERARLGCQAAAPEPNLPFRGAMHRGPKPGETIRCLGQQGAERGPRLQGAGSI